MPVHLERVGSFEVEPVFADRSEDLVTVLFVIVGNIEARVDS